MKGLGTGPGQGHQWSVFGGRGTLGLSRHADIDGDKFASESSKGGTGGHLRFSLAPHPAFSDPDPFGVVDWHVQCPAALRLRASGASGGQHANQPPQTHQFSAAPKQQFVVRPPDPTVAPRPHPRPPPTTAAAIMVSLLLRVLYTAKTNVVSRIHPRRSSPRPCSTQAAAAHRPSAVQNRPSDGRHPPCVLVHQAARP